ncbi:MAG: hypothetical protein IJA78_03790 [Clostridia bacterium]|nr:hypothetical protein [Clostridia bacterium]
MIAASKITFSRLCHEELTRVKDRDGIGLYAEKRLHSVLKRWVWDDLSCHEQKVVTRDEKKTRFVADVLTPSGEIVEIQTASLYPMRKKIAFYMEHTDHPVTVVHPLIAQKHICWMDPATGEITARRRSPRRDTPIAALGELKAFLPYLGNPRFTLCLPLIALEEFRLLDGWGNGGKRGSHRYEQLPTELLDTHFLVSRADYGALLPEGLPESFTAKVFGKATGLRGYALYDALAVLEGLGFLAKCGKDGRSVRYTVL